MYNEFVITMIIPAVGLLLIYAFYRGRLWWLQRSITAVDGSPDAETGALQDSVGGFKEKTAMQARGIRDLAVWLAIGWLFMCYTILCRCTLMQSIVQFHAPSHVPCSTIMVFRQQRAAHESLTTLVLILQDDLSKLCLPGYR